MTPFRHRSRQPRYPSTPVTWRSEGTPLLHIEADRGTRQPFSATTKTAWPVPVSTDPNALPDCIWLAVRNTRGKSPAYRTCGYQSLMCLVLVRFGTYNYASVRWRRERGKERDRKREGGEKERGRRKRERKTKEIQK